MQKVITTRSLLALTAFSFSLLPISGAVEAKPKNDLPDFAPAYGRRGQIGDGPLGRNRPRADFGRVVTLEGVVTARIDNNEFEVRAGGQTFAVRSVTNVVLRTGDPVVLRGYFDGNDNFQAENVRVLGRGNNGNDPRGNGGFGGNYGGGYGNGNNTDKFQNGQRVSVPATFVRAMRNQQFEVFSDAGRTFRVEGHDEANTFRNGERVLVVGIFHDNRIIDAHIVSRNSGNGNYGNGGYGNGNYGNGGYGNGGYGNGNYGNGGFGNGGYGNGSAKGFERTVDFPGRIVSINSRDKTAVVRGDNGRTYRVEGSELNGFESGDRVRVRGIVRDGVIDLQNLDKAR